MSGKLWFYLASLFLVIVTTILVGCRGREEAGLKPVSVPEVTPVATAEPTARVVVATQEATTLSTVAPTQAASPSPAISQAEIETPVSPQAAQTQPAGPTESALLPSSEGTGLSLEAVKEAVEKAREQAAELQEKFPLAKVLPYGGPAENQPFFIAPPRADGTITIVIDEAADIERAKELALEWIKSQGYDPKDYRFEFKVWPFLGPESTGTPETLP
ncbi:MAG: hypothetical protein ACUVWR_19125 [Anaerolineae bacterium]